LSLDFGVEAPCVYNHIIEAPLKRFEMLNDVFLNVSERNEIEIFILSTVFAPAGSGALDVDVGNLGFLFLFNFQANRYLLGNGRFTRATLRAANHNDPSH